MELVEAFRGVSNSVLLDLLGKFVLEVLLFLNLLASVNLLISVVDSALRLGLLALAG